MGQEVYMDGGLRQEEKAGMAKDTKTWNQLARPILSNNAVKQRVKIPPQCPLITSTTIYGVRTKELTVHRHLDHGSGRSSEKRPKTRERRRSDTDQRRRRRATGEAITSA